MSRVGKLAIEVPSAVKLSVSQSASERVVSVQGPKGKVSVPFGRGVDVKFEDGVVTVTPQNQSREAKSNWGTVRTLINNAVVGVQEGWKKELVLSGVGFTAQMSGKEVTLATGYSHKSKVAIPEGVNCQVEKQGVKLESCDKQLVGQVAAVIRAVCPPEPYLGKGIRYSDEVIRRKAGKTGAK